MEDINTNDLNKQDPNLSSDSEDGNNNEATRNGDDTSTVDDAKQEDTSVGGDANRTGEPEADSNQQHDDRGSDSLAGA